LTWPWRNPNHAPTADTLRDQRRWPEAAAAYRAILQNDPNQPPIWTQLGHALKESGDLPAAEQAYRQSIALAPDTADTHLQLGHVLKLQGNRPAAVTAYATALKADRTCTQALTELLTLGESWQAEQASNTGLHLLGSLMQAADQIRTALAQLERALPAATSLAAVPPALFGTRYRLPPAPQAPHAAWSALVLDLDRPQALPRLLRSLADLAPTAVTVLTPDPTAARQFANGGLACPVTYLPPDSPPPETTADWCLLCTTEATIEPGAMPWLDWAAYETTADAFYMDEAATAPVLKAARDPEAPAHRHAALAVRTSLTLTQAALCAPDPLQAVAAGAGRQSHLARILVRRATQRALTTSHPAIPQPDTTRITAIVPTRNGGAMLKDCLETLRANAADPALLDILVIDNGPDDRTTLPQPNPGLTVLRNDTPFNWSLLNNAGAAARPNPLLLFMNDDVTMTTQGWDRTLRHHLARPEIGAVGARLLYPDGTLQHGGIVFGPGGRAEHEGVAAIGVSPDIAARWTTRRRVAAVTGAFLACRQATFNAVGGFDAAHFPIWFNDIDFCLKLREAGLFILYEPAITATHHESRTLSAQPHDTARQAIWDDSLKSLRDRWGEALTIDPGFNPHFARTCRPFELMMEPSTEAIRAHLKRSGQPNPWLVSRQ
jgi:tetratricopeptide (TPR) repeat protein